MESTRPATSSHGPDEGARSQFRGERISELERRLARRSPVGVTWPVAALGLSLCLWLLWRDRLDLAYLASPGRAVELGREGDYHFDRLASNRWAQLHGTPTSRGAYSRDGGKVRVAVGLRETPVVVFREALPGEADGWREGRPPPQPDQRPFAVRGRLLSRPDADRLGLGDALARLEAMGEIAPKWLLVEGAAPRGRPGVLVELGGLSTLALVQLWLLVRAVRHQWALWRGTAPTG